jgi:hypothetical protein
MRSSLWNFARRNYPKGKILSWPLLTLRLILFPLDFVRWRLELSSGYDFMSDTWIINGVRFSSNAFLTLANASGELYIISRNNDTVYIERV